MRVFAACDLQITAPYGLGSSDPSFLSHRPDSGGVQYDNPQRGLIKLPQRHGQQGDLQLVDEVPFGVGGEEVVEEILALMAGYDEINIVFVHFFDDGLRQGAFYEDALSGDAFTAVELLGLLLYVGCFLFTVFHAFVVQELGSGLQGPIRIEVGFGDVEDPDLGIGEFCKFYCLGYQLVGVFGPVDGHEDIFHRNSAMFRLKIAIIYICRRQP